MRWLWIDRIVELVPRQRLVAIKHISLAEDHLHDHFAADPERDCPAIPIMPATVAYSTFGLLAESARFAWSTSGRPSVSCVQVVPPSVDLKMPPLVPPKPPPS